MLFRSVYAESAAHFYYREVEADLQFEIDSKTSRANAVTLLQNGKKCAAHANRSLINRHIAIESL